MKLLILEEVLNRPIGYTPKNESEIVKPIITKGRWMVILAKECNMSHRNWKPNGLEFPFSGAVAICSLDTDKLHSR